MDFFETVRQRHSYRGGFKEMAVRHEDLVRIVQAGLEAPSGCNEQTTQFVIVDDPALLEQIHAMHPANKAMQQARAFIACIVDKQPPDVYEDLSFQVEDCAAAVENMLLAVTALGYASVWMDGWLRREDRAEKIGQLLSVPHDKIVRVILPLGVPEKEPFGPEKRSFAQRAWFNKYNS
jgi:nitroreductase